MSERDSTLMAKGLKHFKSFNNVDTSDTFHNTQFSNLNAALFSYQAILPCFTHNEALCCV